MISVYTEGVGEVVARLDNLNTRMTEELRASISRLTIRLQSKVKQEKLSGQVLNVGRTGDLKRSIQQDVQVSGDKVTGVVSTRLFYGIGWETGWPNGGPGSHLASAKARFALSGSSDTFMNGTPKKRAFLVPALKEFQESGTIERSIQMALNKAAKA